MTPILVITDNENLLHRFREIVSGKNLDTTGKYHFQYAFSPNNKSLVQKYKGEDWITPLKIKDHTAAIIDKYNLVISLHCKQLFPAELVRAVRCINIHPGLNPYNRGWFPQVFSILNGLPLGATIHEIDEEIDHGPIICQKKVPVEMWDTSLTAYNRVLDAEMELVENNLEPILEKTYQTTEGAEGNLNLKKDFNDLCELDLEDKDTFLNHINRLRALTHGDYSNAYFLDAEGKKIGVKIELSLLKES